MKFSPKALLEQLNQPGTIDWAPELKNRREGFEFLIRMVKGEHLDRIQIHNAMHMLFRMAFPENAEEVLQIFVDLTGRRDIKIRSEAIQLAIGLLRTSTNLRTPLLLSAPQESLVRSAVDRGLTTKVANLAREFFTI